MVEHHKPAKDIYDDGRLFIDFSEQTACLNGKPLPLSPMEFKMSNLFRKNPKQVLTRGWLLEKLWDTDERFVDEHTLTTSISRIRSKIESDDGPPYTGAGHEWNCLFCGKKEYYRRDFSDSGEVINLLLCSLAEVFQGYWYNDPRNSCPRPCSAR